MSGKIEAVLLHIIGLLKTDITDYCDLETTDGGKSIVAQDGSLASIVRFDGTKSVLGRDQYEELIKRLEGSLSVFFKERGHQIQVVFRRDLDARAALEANASQQRSTAERIHLNVVDLIDESVVKYSGYVYDEECYMVFWSRPCLLDAVEAKVTQQATNKFRKDNNWPAMGEAQNLLRPMSFLLDRHLAFVTRIADDLSSPEFGCSAEILNVSAALRTIRAGVYPDITAPNWSPSIPGTAIPIRWKTNSDEKDMSEFSYPPLPNQLMVAMAELGKPSNPAIPDSTMVRVGSRVYAPLMISIPPREPQLFNTLFMALNRAETTENGKSRAIPYSISFMIEADGMGVMMFKGLFANLLSVTSETNQNINLASKALAEFKRDSGCVVKLRISAMTWAGIDKDGVRELTLRKSKLWRTLESWGSPVVIERTGNPMIAFQSNCLGLTMKHIGNPCPAPLGDALALLPLTRPASPFPTGSIIYRSLDGKILRYQRFSSLQSTWISLVAGKPGSGKSVLMNNNNFESCLLPGIRRLPYIGILDIGISSAGFIDLIRDALPDRMQHLAIYKRLQNSERDCINPLDTPLGKREPLPKDREFIKNFVCMMVTPPERQGKPYEGMTNFVGRMIDLAYQRRSDRLEKAQPETYKRGHNSVVDEAVEKLGIKIWSATTYWELVDHLFKAGMIVEAELTQRYAVPTLDDLVAVASSEEVTSEYADITSNDGRSLAKAFTVGIREAVADFPIFSSHTRFDIGNARVIALDLQDVAIIGSDSAKKQTSLMYMIARQSFMKKVAFSVEDLPYFDEMYKSYYEHLISDLIDENKVLCMDEFHKTGGHELLKQQVLNDGREARKWNLEIILASQLMEDFGELTKIATAIFILDSGTEETRRWLRENIGLSSVEESALVNYVHGANEHGATFLCRFATKNAVYSQLFTMTAGAMRLWALSTTSEDRKLRSLLYAAMPRPLARNALAKRFPSGSCKRLVERLKAEEFSDVEFVDDDMVASVIERIASEMLAKHFEMTEA